jgi:Pyruvate/2-oxoacid:ferredoxin oxidoreductase delta subunit
MLAKLFFATDRCNGCGLCAERCPHRAIRMWRPWGRRERRPYWTFACESCMRCMNLCPTKAVEASHSFAALLVYITGLPVATWGLARLTDLAPWLHWTNNPVVATAAQWAYALVSIYLLSLLLTLLLQVPVVNQLFAYTTLTRWFRRYHAPGVTPRDLTR